MDEYIGSLLNKMHKRGWKTQILPFNEDEGGIPDACLGLGDRRYGGHRRIGDGRSWRMELLIEGMPHP